MNLVSISFFPLHFNGAFNQNLVKHETSGGENGSRSWPASVNHNCKGDVGACAEPSNGGRACESRGVSLDKRSGDSTRHIHCVDCESRAAAPCAACRYTSKALKAADHASASLLCMERQRGKHRNEASRASRASFDDCRSRPARNDAAVTVVTGDRARGEEQHHSQCWHQQQSRGPISSRFFHVLHDVLL